MFRFTIRELVLLTFIVAMGVALWVEHRRSATWNSRANAAKSALRNVGYRAIWKRDGALVLNESERTVMVYGQVGQLASPDEN